MCNNVADITLTCGCVYFAECLTETEALMSSSDAVPIVGGISVAVLFLVVIVIVLIFAKR